MHCTEMFVFRLDTDNFFATLIVLEYLVYRPVMNGISPVSNHHHTKIVALEHFVVGFLKVGSLACAFFRKDAA